jgi:hypothetical protein
MHTIAILTLFQLAAPSGVNALVSSPTLGYTLAGNRLVRLAGVPGVCYTTPDPTATLYTHVHSASAAQATLLVTDGAPATLIYRTALADITITLPEPPQHTAISPTGAYFATLASSRLSLYRRSGSAPVATVEPPSLPIPADVTALAIGDYGDTVLTTPTGFWYSARPGGSFTSISIAATFLRFQDGDSASPNPVYSAIFGPTSRPYSGAGVRCPSCMGNNPTSNYRSQRPGADFDAGTDLNIAIPLAGGGYLNCGYMGQTTTYQVDANGNTVQSYTGLPSASAPGRLNAPLAEPPCEHTLRRCELLPVLRGSPPASPPNTSPLTSAAYFQSSLPSDSGYLRLPPNSPTSQNLSR